MPERSAGILLFRRAPGALAVFLVHPGGPFWAKKDEGAWSIPKGLINPGEAPAAAAEREFGEETGLPVDSALIELGEFRLPSGKRLVAFALEGDADPAAIRSNHFSMEWPPRSGQEASFPEVDRASWFDVDTARLKLNKGQLAVLDALLSRLGGPTTA